MKYGYFDDHNKEYVITDPKTPYPWINYLGSQSFFGLISNTAGGYCFYRDARLRRITRYRYNNVPADAGGRYFYINDSGDVWSPSWKPVKKELSFYECRHGLGYTRIAGARNGVTVGQLFFVPLDMDCEVHQVQIRNESSAARELSLFSFIEFCLWDANDDATNFQRNFSIGEVEVEGSVIYHKTEYRERRNHYAFYGVNADIDGFDTDRDSFLGLYNGFHEPEVVLAGKAKNSMAHGWAPIASHWIQVVLQPGEEKTLVFILGYAENEKHEKFAGPGVINKAKAKAVLNQFRDETAVSRALDELKAYWDQLLGKYQLQSGDERLNRVVNIWNPYQCMVTFNLSRSASYFESGIGRGIGFRDSNQDILGFVHQAPKRARERILDLAATQLEDGSAYHQYQPLTKQGNDAVGSGFNDDPLWLIVSTAAYLKETGDFSILREQVPFDSVEHNRASLFEHLRCSFDHVNNNLGPHGLPLIGRADWNDCLNLNCFSEEPGEPFQTTGPSRGPVAESVFIAGLYVYAGRDYIEICRHLGEPEEAERAAGLVAEMEQRVLAQGWDGEWFLRAYDAFGQKIGSRECAEGQIFIEPQGFCVMAGIGIESGCAEKALDAVKERLDTPYGLVLQQPAYSQYYLNLGEISSYPPGYKENAGIFCHNNPWVACAEAAIGRGGRAFDIWRKITPAYKEEISEIHRMEPYVYSQMIAGKDAARHGEAKNSWLTGTAAWSYVAVTQWILGIKPDYDGLRIDPCIPQEWTGYRVRRHFRNAVYDITVKNPRQVMRGVAKIIVDGTSIAGNIIPVFGDGKAHRVEVELGGGTGNDQPKTAGNTFRW